MLNRLLAECLGTAVLLCSVVGSGIMAERLASGNIAVALLANTLATVFALYVLIEIFAPISGAHFNPAVSLVMRIKGKLTSSEMLGYFVVQLFGAALGVWLAHLMFDMPIFELSSKVRTGIGQWIAEIVATTGLLLVILRSPPGKVSAVVAYYIGAAYWFTASTSFANPAAVFGRMMSDSFAGILPSNALAFVAAELIGALLALLLNRSLGRTAD
jgi:glycerol uptake facilitator-like aquaporin